MEAEAIEPALHALAGRYEILRTRIETGPDGGAAQVIDDESTVALEECARAGRIDVGIHAVLDRRSDTESILTLTQPAFAADPASMRILVEELAAHVAGEVAATDEPMQYADLAQWLRETRESEEGAEGRAFWQATDLSGIEDSRLGLETAVDSDGPFSPEVAPVAVDPGIASAINELAATLDVSPAAPWLAAWQLLLARHTEGERTVVGICSEGRGYEGLDRALGLFRQYLPVASTVIPADPFVAHVRRAEDVIGAAEEQHEFFALADELRGLPYLFAHRSAAVTITKPGSTWTLLDRDGVTDRFRLELSVDEGGDASLRYDPAAFTAEDAACLAEQYTTLLGHVVREPHAAVAGIDIVGDEERRLLLEEFSGTAADVVPALLPDLIAEQAQRNPAAIAVAAEGREISYRELDEHANRLARRLRADGAQTNGFVGIFMTRSPEMIVAIVAVLRAGAAYLPLPPAYPRERIAFMLEDTGAPIVLTRAADREGVPPTAARIVDLDDAAEALASEDASPLPSPAAEDLAYVIYTSGSTGKPKGVPITHGNLAHSTHARLTYYDHAPTGYLLLSSFAFDSSVPGIFWTLAHGGRLVLPAEKFEQDVAALGPLIAKHRPSHLLALPSVYTLLLDHTAPADLASLNTVIVAGESSARELVDRHFATLPDVQLHNEYGPTEGTVWSSVADCAEPSRRATVSIGRPVPGVRTYLVDDAGRLAAIGTPGEIWIGGAQISPGYLGRAELTQEKFLDDPFGGTGRLYRTGDLGRFLPDGRIEFLGRIDHQVKIRGYRIELEEIETVLATHESVHEAVVIAREDRPGDKRLAAYVTGRDGATPDPTALLAHLAAPLPEYMVPTHFVVLAAMPRLPNGKVDRHALPAPEEAGGGAEYVPPRTSLERLLAGIWAEVLGVERIGIEEDFFAAGGHSLLATQLFARMREMLQLTAPLRLLFDHRTIDALAGELRRDPAEGARLEKIAELTLQVLGISEETDS